MGELSQLLMELFQLLGELFQLFACEMQVFEMMKPTKKPKSFLKYFMLVAIKNNKNLNHQPFALGATGACRGVLIGVLGAAYMEVVDVP